MDITIYNTFTRSKEVFKPLIRGQLSMYNCGPTVYDYAHIGNFRAYVFADILRRIFEYNSYKVTQVINITDVGHLVSESDEGEDKMTKALRRENQPMTLEAMLAIGDKYFKKFVEDLKNLNIESPEYYPKASEHIAEDIDIVQILEKKGIAYKTSDGMYFDTAKFPNYGKLGNIDIGNLKEGARVTANTEKHNPIDFCLWKFDKNLGWESPWGKGFPGWHIECSAMSRKYLSQPFDIHTGGIDHIPVHHNNEIAQSEAAYDVPLARYWMHGAHLSIDNSKISKSAGNSIFLSTLLENSISVIAYRYWLLTSHYRSPVNFTFEAVRGAQNALIRLMALVREYPEHGQVSASYKERFNAFINDDLNMPGAVALAWELVKDEAVDDADKKATLLNFDKVYGLGLDAVPKVKDKPIPPEITALSDAREEARKAKDWKKADALRHEIESRGYSLTDSADSIRIKFTSN